MLRLVLFNSLQNELIFGLLLLYVSLLLPFLELDMLRHHFPNVLLLKQALLLGEQLHSGLCVRRRGFALAYHIGYLA